jgi:DNA gyrase inhibitor GyrI
MRKLKMLTLVLAVIVLTLTATVEICAEQTADKSNFTIRKLETQTVLYTIYRGQYQDIGKTIGDLYALAIKNQIWPRGSLTFVFLNNPQYVSGEHCLVEIRIPVGQDALKLAGTLGEMTDVKTIKGIEAAVVNKPAGQTDYSSIFNNIYTWIAKQGYRAVDNACETFDTNSGVTDYTKITSEIMIPVVNNL